MAKSILYIKSSSLADVRINKFYNFFKSKDEYIVNFWGWDRYNKNVGNNDANVQYIFNGIFINLLVSYCIFMILLFFRMLFVKRGTYKNIICINFETALPIYLVSKIRGDKFIYEIYDEFSKSYSFPNWLKCWLEKIDLKIIDRADYVIHVDENRIIGPEKNKSIIIENTPFDYWNGQEREYINIKHKFAIVGFFSDARGMEQIYEFAKSNFSIQFLLAGRFTNELMKNSFLQLPNIEFHDFMPQKQLFKLMEDCCAIFSLYNPSLEINKYAASNKVYDAMMMGFPVITKEYVINSQYIMTMGCGMVVNYKYDSSWSQFEKETFVQQAVVMGRKGRKLYLDKYRFEYLVSTKLLPIL